MKSLYHPVKFIFKLITIILESAVEEDVEKAITVVATIRNDVIESAVEEHNEEVVAIPIKYSKISF
jgi:hypothetical protein